MSDQERIDRLDVIPKEDMIAIEADIQEVDTDRVIKEALESTEDTVGDLAEEFPGHVSPNVVEFIQGVVGKIREGEAQEPDELSLEEILHMEAGLAKAVGDLESARRFLLASASLEIAASGTPYAATCLVLGDVYKLMGNMIKAVLYYSAVIHIVESAGQDNAQWMAEYAQKGLEDLSMGDA